MPPVFQLVLPFQLDLPFDQGESAPCASPDQPAPRPEGKRRRARVTSARAELPDQRAAV